MTIAVVQHDAVQKGSGGPWSSATATFPGATTADNDLWLIAYVCDAAAGTKIVLPTEDVWTEVYRYDSVGSFVVARRTADGTETTATITATNTAGTPVSRDRFVLSIGEVSGQYGGFAAFSSTGNTSNPHSVPSVTPGSGIEALFVAGMIAGNAYGITAHPAAYTLLDEEVANTGASERLAVYSRHDPSTSSGGYTDTMNYAGVLNRERNVQLWYTALPVFDADFAADAFSGNEPLTVNFTDLTVGDPTSWAWDFGDGGTSTSQDPTHIYAAAGVYTVSLTASKTGDSDTETKTAYISVTTDVGYEAPPPAGAIVEIYAAEAGAARWDMVDWDEAVWSGSRWQDVTPQSVDLLIRWGSSEPERGILSRPSAGSWSVVAYDPERLLDPSNADGPFYGDLEPGLPIRVNHRGITVRQGVAESIGHSFLDGVTRNGYIRVTDNLSRLANAAVPSDTTLSDTLYARARDAISAAGISVQVLPDPPSGDPALVAWATGVNEWTAWQWIQDAAEQVLHIPYIDRIGRLGFRPWAIPLYRGRVLAAPELIDLQAITDYKGRYSVVQGTDTDGETIVERALTPTPSYGTRTYLRTDPTPDVGDWAQAVLEDRSLPGLRWVPGELFPLDADSVERLATIEAVELVGISDDTQTPAVAVDAIIVGGTIRIWSKRADAATWRFTFDAAQVPALPLVVSGSDPPEFLLRTAGGEYLYPS